MNGARRSRILILSAALLLPCRSTAAQDPPSEQEFWASVKANIELRSKLRLQVFGEFENGEEFPYQQWKAGAMLRFRMKRLVEPHWIHKDEEHAYGLVLGAGYEYLETTQKQKGKREDRITFAATPRLLPGARFAVTDQNRVELRWVNDVYDVRYRNKLLVERPFDVHDFRFAPYLSAEAFYDRKYHSWNERQYAVGLQLPHKRKAFMVDTYYLYQTCTTCSEDPVNVVGVTLNLFLRSAKGK